MHHHLSDGAQRVRRQAQGLSHHRSQCSARPRAAATASVSPPVTEAAAAAAAVSAGVAEEPPQGWPTRGRARCRVPGEPRGLGLE